MSLQYEDYDPFRPASKWNAAGDELKLCVATGFAALAALLLCLFTSALAVSAPNASLHGIRLIGAVFLGLAAAGNGALSLASGFRALRAFVGAR